MISVVGVFKTRSEAERAVAELVPLGIPRSAINFLTPEVTEKELATVPTISAEQPGLGKAIGAVVGGAVGMAGGIGLGEALAALFVPGVGPVLAVGLGGAALLGTLGAVTGAATGSAIENAMTNGLPDDELFVYEDALRKGRTVLIARAQDKTQAKAARGVLEHAGAESIDRAREMWWISLRDVEKRTYEAEGRNFQEDERYFRCGFEAALHSKNRSKSYEQCHLQLGDRYPGIHEREPFRRGFTRGQAYLEEMKKRKN